MCACILSLKLLLVVIAWIYALSSALSVSVRQKPLFA